MNLIQAQRAYDTTKSELKNFASKDSLTEGEKKEVDTKMGELRSLQDDVQRLESLAKLKEQQDKVVPIKDNEDRDWQTRCRDYSTANVVAKLSTRAETDTGSEDEITQELRQRYPEFSVGDYVVPWEALSTRALATTGVGAALQDEDYKPSMLIEFLRPMLGNLGVTMLSGLNSDCRLPKKMSQNNAASWLSETGEASEGTPSFGSVSLSPHKVGAIGGYSLQAMIQSQPSVETITRQDLQDSLADYLNAQFLYASGTNAPSGIATQLTATARPDSTNGKPLALADLIVLQLALAEENVGMGTWLINPRTRARLMQEHRFGEDAQSDETLWSNGGVLGMPTVVSNHVSKANTKGTGTGLSDVFYCRWSDAIIASWGGGLNLMSNPYSKFKSGGVEIRILGFFDYAMRHGESFKFFNDVIA